MHLNNESNNKVKQIESFTKCIYGEIELGAVDISKTHHRFTTENMLC